MAEINETLANRRSELALRRGALSALKQQELERLLNKAASEQTPARVIPQRPSDQPAPLSFAQERLWFLHQLEPDSITYNICLPLRITGRLNIPAMSQSINEVMRRHESLRTTFAAREGHPVQVIVPPPNGELPLTDVSTLPESQRQTVVKRLTYEGYRHQFDLSNGPLFDPLLLRLAREEHILLLRFHHIIFDQWSLDILTRDVGKCYQAFEQGHASSLPEPRLQYADFAHWHRESLTADVLDREVSYWRKQLEDSPEIMNLPTDRPRPRLMTYEGDTVEFELSESLTERLRGLTRSTGSSLFMTLLASFQMVLSRYTGQDDIVLATPITGRNSVDTEDLIGFFINTLLIRTKLSGNPSLREVTERVRETVLEAQTHQDLPFEKLVEELHPERSLSHGPLFEVMFVFKSNPRTAMEVRDVSMNFIELESGAEKFGITFVVAEGPRKLGCSLSYRSDIFDRSTIERLGKHWQQLLSAMVADPDQRLADVELLDQAEQAQILKQWNDTATTWPTPSVLSLFAQQVERTPDVPAVQFADQYLSYRQLDTRANQVANYLRGLGVAKDARVGICFEPSPEMVTAVLGVLKAGAAYVPLDPAYPAERLSLMVSNAGCVALLTRESLLPSVPEIEGTVICLDRDWPAIANESDADPGVQIDPENLVNVIYTSGSTGVPKGVAMTHRALSNLVCWQTNEKSQPGRTLQFASLSFDVSFQEIFTTWCSGGTLILVTNDQRHDANRMLEFLAAEQVERVDFPFVYLQHLAEAYEQGGPEPAALRDVIAAGEQLECTSQIRQFCERVQFNLYNHYGPSETHVVTQHHLTGAPAQWPTLAPIGRPVANSQIYILDQRLKPVPVGVAGELFIGGTNLSRGYLHRPELTAERYVPNPFGDAGERLYRTGDLARYLVDGTVEFLGRIDTQVKIRGFRIELGEIEAALRTHPQVLHALVVAHGATRSQRRLVAYVVGADGVRPNLNDLKTWLKNRLPAYMAPSGWVLLDELPLTPSGKINRAALPEPEIEDSLASSTYAPPQTLVEEMVASIWQQVLRLERVSRDDNFFWLGGHSLLATRITSRIRDAFNIDLPVRVLFEAPTIAELAGRIETTMGSGAVIGAPALKPVVDDGQLPLSYAQQRLWFLNQLMPSSTAYHLPAELALDTTVVIGTMEQAFNEVLRRHQALRTTFVLIGSQPVQRINPPPSFMLPLVDLSRLSADERPGVAERVRQEIELRPFDLEKGPLVRTILVRSDGQESLFLLNMHHIVTDGWSMCVLLRDVETIYFSYLKGQPSPLPELEVQYADYAHWQRDWLQGEVLEAEVDFWRHQLEGAPTLLELETGHPRQVLRSVKGAQHPVFFSEAVSQWLREFHRHEGATLFMAIMAGFHALLWRYTGQNDILVGTPIASRTRIELEPMIGFFVNMIPIRTSFTRCPTFRELVHQVRDSALAAYTHQELPFDKLVEELQPKRAPGRNPIFQAILAVEIGAPEMQLAKVSVPAGAPVSADIKFDLEVYLRDMPNGIQGSFVYSSDLFEPAFISRMVYHFQQLFEKAMLEPDSELSTLSLLDEGEYRQVVEEWNDTAVPIPDGSIHHVFEREVAVRPDAIALEFGDEQISYRELNQRANQLAQRLRREGVGPEVFVGVMLERSTELIVALLGITKAGGVYVPLNLTDPQKRIEFVLDDAGARVVVTRRQMAANLESQDLTLVYIDEVSEESDEAPHVNLIPDNLAFMLYTSGSTGIPKGVGITHRNIVGFVKTANFASLTSDEIVLHICPISFDLSMLEIWGALLNGGRLVVFPPTLPSLSELGDFVTRTQVTTVLLTTGLFHQFVEANLTNIGSIRQLLTGGDALSPTHASRALEQMDNVKIVNGYGPTESTIFTSCYQVERDRIGASVPIGRPVSNTRVYIINAMQPAGVGERGELFIGGHGLARGYHRRPDQTAERFQPDPYGPQPGGRLYRTGDAARYLNDGMIQFLGRIDDQLKISGFRIEPREITAVLSTHPSLTAAVVVAREDTPGQKVLVAYVVGNTDSGPNTDELRSYLKERLPEYMVPSVFVPLAALPLTTNGKVDWRALPAPQVSLTRAGREYIAPRNDLQQQLVDIWEELFKLHPIGITDNFFELGGHSLQMIMLVARVEERLGKRVAMAELFDDPTIEHLADLIGHGKESLSQSLLVPLQAEGTKPTLFGPHASGGSVWCYKELVQALGNEQPFYAVQPRAPENGSPYHNEIEAMASDYVQAIRGYQPNGPYWLTGWSMGGVIAYEIARQLQQQGQQIAMLALIDAAVPEAEETEYHWAILLSLFAYDLGLKKENIKKPLGASLSQMVQLRQVWAEARRAGVVPSEISLVEFRQLFDTFKIHANIMLRYHPGEFHGPVTLFRPEEEVDEFLFGDDPRDPAWKAERRIRNRLKGWDRLVTGDVELRIVPGNHFSMLRDPNVQVLAEQLRECAARSFAQKA